MKGSKPEECWKSPKVVWQKNKILSDNEQTSLDMDTLHICVYNSISKLLVKVFILESHLRKPKFRQYKQSRFS